MERTTARQKEATAACALIAAGAEAATETRTIPCAVLKRSLTIVIDTPRDYDGSNNRYPVLYARVGLESLQFVEAGLPPGPASR